MQRSFFTPLLSLLLFGYSIGACTGPGHEAGGQVAGKDSVVALDAVSVELPYAKGVELVERACVPCHSLRYIEMQPQMPRKAWEKIVDKMIHAYGAPVADSASAREIVDYLVAVKGS